MPRFLVVRHGETEWNKARIRQGWADSPLTESGIAQVRNALNTFNESPDIILASDLLRARHTAELFAEKLPDTPLLYDWRLRERSFGSLESRPVEDSQTIEDFDGDGRALHGAEPISHFTNRVRYFIRDCALFNAKTFLIVSHSGVVNRFGNLFIEDFKNKTWPNGEVVEFEIDYNHPSLTTDLPNLAWIPGKTK